MRTVANKVAGASPMRRDHCLCFNVVLKLRMRDMFIYRFDIGVRLHDGNAEDVQLWTDLRLNDLKSKPRFLGYLGRRGYAGGAWIKDDDQLNSRRLIRRGHDPGDERDRR